MGKWTPSDAAIFGSSCDDTIDASSLGEILCFMCKGLRALDLSLVERRMVACDTQDRDVDNEGMRGAD